MQQPPVRIVRETDAEARRLAATLIRSARFGALATIQPGGGHPLATRVGVATDADATPIILISQLAAHTKALQADPRCSLLVGEPGRGDPLSHPRMSLVCRARSLPPASAELRLASARYLRRHPKSVPYAGLSDFGFFRLEVIEASLNGGFAKAYRLVREDLVRDDPGGRELAELEQSAIDHMNRDHPEVTARIARHFGKVEGKGWTLAGIDMDGLDFTKGDKTVRIFFERPLGAAAELQGMLAEMSAQARAAEEQHGPG